MKEGKRKGIMEGETEEAWESNPPFYALQKCSISEFLCTTGASWPIRVLSPFVYVAEIAGVDKLNKYASSLK